jgi:broad specificity phosphatase PhoE
MTPAEMLRLRREFHQANAPKELPFEVPLHTPKYREDPYDVSSVPSPFKPQGINIERGGSSIPLIDQGRRQIAARGRQLKKALGAHRAKIIAPDLSRTIETAEILHRETRQPITEISPDWMTQRMGWMEGLPSDDIRQEKIRLRSKARNEVPPGMGPFSTAPGESTNTFLDRWLGKFRPLLRSFKKDPHQIIILVNHYSGIKAVQAGFAKAKKEGKLSEGILPDLSIDQAEFLRHDGAPGDIHRVYLCSHGDFHIDDIFDLGKVKPGEMPWGIYIMRHGLTAWNEEAKPEAEVKAADKQADSNDAKSSGMSLEAQAKLRDNLRDIMRSPGYTRMPTQTRVKIQNARFQLESSL